MSFTKKGMTGTPKDRNRFSRPTSQEAEEEEGSRTKIGTEISKTIVLREEPRVGVEAPTRKDSHRGTIKLMKMRSRESSFQPEGLIEGGVSPAEAEAVQRISTISKRTRESMRTRKGSRIFDD